MLLHSCGNPIYSVRLEELDLAPKHRQPIAGAFRVQLMHILHINIAVHDA